MKVKRIVPWRYIAPYALILAFIVPRFLVSENTGLLSALILLIAVSRASPLFEKMLLEVHSVIILMIGMLIGPGAVIAAAVIAIPLIFYLNPRFGNVPNPAKIYLDSAAMAALGLIGVLIPSSGFVFAGMVAIIVVNYVMLNLLQTFISPEPLGKKIAVSMPAAVVNYIVLNTIGPYLITVFA